MKHVVGFSGGADSQACLNWVLDRFPKEDVIATFADTGNEHPITLEHVQYINDHVHPIAMIQPIVADMAGRANDQIEALGLKPDDPLDFSLMAVLKGFFPMTKHRFCTDHLKLHPQIRWTKANLPDRVFERYIGVRRDESASRADVDEREWDDQFDCWINRPLATWTKAQVFEYIESKGQQVNPLYRMGFERVGCAPCINSRKSDVRLWAARFPEMIDKIRAWERRVGKPFFPPGKVPGLEAAWIDAVVDWARTTRGGRQFGLPLLEADIQAGVCMSKYGLCE